MCQLRGFITVFDVEYSCNQETLCYLVKAKGFVVYSYLLILAMPYCMSRRNTAVSIQHG